MEKEHTTTEPARFTFPHNTVFQIIMITLLLYLLFSSRITFRRIPKKDLVNVYGIDKKSFNKWVQYFCTDIITDIQVYKRKRTVSMADYILITLHLGTPDDHPILSKKDIVNAGEGTYRSLRESVKLRPSSYGLPSYDAFLNLQKFPPNVARRILEQYA